MINGARILTRSRYLAHQRFASDSNTQVCEAIKLNAGSVRAMLGPPIDHSKSGGIEAGALEWKRLSTSNVRIRAISLLSRRRTVSGTASSFLVALSCEA